MTTTPLVDGFSEFNLVKAELGRVLDLAARLPASPFRKKAGFFFCEFEVFRNGDFGRALELLALGNGDEYVSGAAVVPDIESYYLPEYGSFASFRFPGETAVARYPEALAYEPEGDDTAALLYSADILAVAGSSGRWSAWGERELGVAIIHVDGSDPGWQPAGMHFGSSADDALYTFVEPSFSSGSIPRRFRKEFLANFAA